MFERRKEGKKEGREKKEMSEAGKERRRGR